MLFIKGGICAFPVKERKFVCIANKLWKETCEILHAC